MNALLRGALTSLPTIALLAALTWPRFSLPDPVLVILAAEILVFVALSELWIDRVSHAITSGGDKSDRIAYGVSVLVALILGGLDGSRFYWLPPLPERASWAGVVLLALAWSMRLWTYRVNRFFSNVLVIQKERGHVVIDSGPYAVVRHPGYAALVVLLIAIGLALGSWLGLVVLGAGVIATLRRTALEDRFLHNELPGYADYATRVRYKLIPGVY